MPYHLETGPNLEVLEDFMNGDVDRLVKALSQLRGTTPLCDIGVFDSTTLDGGPLDKAQRNAHLMEDWFGMSQNANGAWVKQKKFSAKSNATTGYWQGWYGDCEKIVRLTLRRAAEVALGLGYDDPIPEGFRPSRHWPIQFLWKCAQPWFEGWITWRSDHSRGGHVTVLWCTPAQGDPVLTSPLAPPQRNLPDYARDPKSAAGAEGMWVVTHETQQVEMAITTEPSGLGQWRFPQWGPVYVGTGDVVTVQPSEADGGVLSGGRAWIP